MGQIGEFRMPSVVFYDRDSLSKVGEQASLLGKKALIVSDRVMERLGTVNKCAELLLEYGCSYVSYLDVNSEPTDAHVSEALDIFIDNRCDLIIAIGGGSCLDTGKAVALVGANGGYIGDYRDGKRAADSSIPFIAIPTTAGTGSEVTNVTVITNTKDDVKMMIKHPKLMPSIAIVDPVLTLSTPPSVTAATGIDAFCHATEAFISRRARLLTDNLALSAIGLIAQNINTVYRDGDNLDAREKMALASMQAGAAFSNSSVTLVHGMSRPIGALFHVPHGISNAMLLPAVMEFTRDSAVERFAVIGNLLRPDLKGLTENEMADVAIHEIRELCRMLNIPNMKTWGIEKGKLDQLVNKMATDAIASGSPANNPRVPTHQEIVELYYRCYDYDFNG